jgi:hypothetical protein
MRAATSMHIEGSPEYIYERLHHNLNIYMYIYIFMGIFAHGHEVTLHTPTYARPSTTCRAQHFETLHPEVM